MIRLLAISLLLLLSSPAFAAAGFSVHNLSPSTVNSRTTLVGGSDMFAERNGDIHTAWVQISQGQSDVYYYRFNNASGRWLSGVRLTEGANASNVSVSGDYLGNIHVVWQDRGSIFHAMWNVTSEEWNSPDLVSKSGCCPIVICDGTPNTHVIWIEKENHGRSFLAHTYMDPYGNWTGMVAVTPKEGRVSELAATIDDKNGLHVAFKMELDLGKGFDLYYVHRRAGREWDPYRRLAEATEGRIRTPSIAVDDDGFVHVVWVQGTGDRSRIYSRSWRGGWEEAKTVINSSTASNPYVCSDEDGNLHLVWEDRPNGTNVPAVFYERYWKIGVWSYPIIIGRGEPGRPRYPPRVVVSPRTQNVNVLWTVDRGGTGTVIFARLQGNRRLDVLRAASSAQASLSEVKQQVLHSRKAQDKLADAQKAFDDGVEFLREIDPRSALSRFQSCSNLIDEAESIEDAYKQKYGKRMGITFAAAGMIVAIVILVGWAVARRRESESG